MRPRHLGWAALVLVAVMAGGYAAKRVAPFARWTRSEGPKADAPTARVVTPAPPAPTASLHDREAMAGLDLLHVRVDDAGATAPVASGAVARLTLDVGLQRTAAALLRAHQFPEAAIVMMDPETGEVLAYASHVEGGPARDANVVASAPAASVFKIVTAAALVEKAGLGPETRQCYSGGEQRILPIDLVDEPQRDRWCVTLAGAMGRSVNTVFARLAQKNLAPAALEDAARSFGFGEPVPFDVPVEPSTLTLPPDALGFARTAAGFWNTRLSPLEAVWLSATVARGGESMRPFIVADVTAPGAKAPAYVAPPPQPVRRAVGRETAQALTTMMEHTVSEGTSYKAFHDPSGTSFLPGVTVAGKTGTLTDGREGRMYTWFTGFAPSRPVSGVRTVAIAVLVANKLEWRMKANTVAREMLRAHFAEQKVPGVTRPVVTAIAHREEGLSSRSRGRASR